MAPSLFRAIGLSAAAFLALLIPGAAAASAPPSFPVAFAQSLARPTAPPPGAVAPSSCRVTAEHPRPVILLHGTYANPYNSFGAMAPALAARGWCVIAPALGASPVAAINGWRPVLRSADQLAALIDDTLAHTGAAQVDLVGYSQGGLVARAYLTDPTLGAEHRAKVHALVGLSVPNHGTAFGGLATLVSAYRLGPLLRGVVGQGALDLLAGSGFLRELAARGEVLPGVAATMIATTTDEISVPARRAWLAGSADHPVSNLLLQRSCPVDLSDHLSITYSPRAIALVERALEPGARIRVPCSLRWPVL